MKRLGLLFWAAGFFMVMVGSLIRGPALGIGATIDHPRWQTGYLAYEFGGTTYQAKAPNPQAVPPTISLTSHYTTPLADWDSILLLGQGLEVRSATGAVIYQTDTTRLRLDQTAIMGLTAGQVADGLVWMGAAACLVGPLLVMLRGHWLIPAVWIMAVLGYLVV
ncbi:MAG: hypothetical protein BroJett018_25170 [Chloroflexota bacterium]|nr:MAG: hypothetical protein BroJett018_25170 [Chloroflexota bacterium]